MLRAIGLRERLLRLDRRLLFEFGVVWTGGTLANILFYLYQVMVGRRLGPEEFGLFTALFGVVYLASGLMQAIQATTARLVAEDEARGRGLAGRDLVVPALLRVSLLGLGTLVVFTAMSPWIASYVKTGAATPVAVTGLIIFVMLALPVAHGALQGLQHFALYSGVTLLHAGTRLGLGALALGMKWGTLGVLGAAGGASVITASVAIAAIRPSFKVSMRRGPSRGALSVLIPALIAAVAVIFPGSVDVIMVRHFFSPMDSGLYSGTATLGKIVLFLPAAACTVLFPKFAADSIHGTRDPSLLFKGLIGTAALAGVVAAVFGLLPGTSLSLLLGDGYAGAQGLVAAYAASMFVFSLTLIVANYHLARGGHTYFYLILLPHLVAIVALIYAFHQSLLEVVLVSLTVNCSLAGASGAFTVVSFRRASRARRGVVDGHPFGENDTTTSIRDSPASSVGRRARL